MSTKHRFSDEQKAELLSNPYTVRVTDCKIVFSLAFKQFVMKNINNPDMTSSKIFKAAGYSDDIIASRTKRGIIRAIRLEAESAEGLKEPAPVKKHNARKKHSETEFKELQERVTILEQQVNFLKKSQALKKQQFSNPPTNSG